MVVTRPPVVVKVAVTKPASRPKAQTKGDKTKATSTGTDRAFLARRAAEEGNLGVAARLMGQ